MPELFKMLSRNYLIEISSGLLALRGPEYGHKTFERIIRVRACFVVSEGALVACSAHNSFGSSCPAISMGLWLGRPRGCFMLIKLNPIRALALAERCPELFE